MKRVVEDRGLGHKKKGSRVISKYWAKTLSSISQGNWGIRGHALFKNNPGLWKVRWNVEATLQKIPITWESTFSKKPNTIILGISITVIRTMIKSHLVWKDFILTYNCCPHEWNLKQELKAVTWRQKLKQKQWRSTVYWLAV